MSLYMYEQIGRMGQMPVIAAVPYRVPSRKEGVVHYVSDKPLGKRARRRKRQP